MAPDASTGDGKPTLPEEAAGEEVAEAEEPDASKTDGRPSVPPKYPRHTLEKALRIPKAIYDQNGGNPATPSEAASFLGSKSARGKFGVEISSAKKYGFLDTDDEGRLVLTDRARRAIAPQSPTDKTTAFQEAVLAAPDVSAVYNYYRGQSLPDRQFLNNALIERFKLPAEKTDEFLTIFYEDIRSAGLLDESGERHRLLDVGRDESHKPSPGKPQPAKPAKGLLEKDASCFVMQPFAGPLGSYYNSIFKPAIEQTGLQPVRADDDIFATGKIMDQVWRGIRAAKVLVAELTTKNPNVFYELGLAHALNKPVVLVSSNEEDVPFDLRHIRVILYDMTDPFWGQKLIDKVADNIKIAIENPEDAIFRIEEV